MREEARGPDELPAELALALGVLAEGDEEEMNGWNPRTCAVPPWRRGFSG